MCLVPSAGRLCQGRSLCSAILISAITADSHSNTANARLGVMDSISIS